MSVTDMELKNFNGMLVTEHSEDNSIYNIDFVFFDIFKTDDNLLIKCADTMNK